MSAALTQQRSPLTAIASQRQWLSKQVSQDSVITAALDSNKPLQRKQQFSVAATLTESAAAEDTEEELQQLVRKQAAELAHLREVVKRQGAELDELKAVTTGVMRQPDSAADAADAAEFARFKGMLQNLQQVVQASVAEGNDEASQSIKKSDAFKQAGAMLRGWIERFEQSAAPLAPPKPPPPPVVEARVLSALPPAPMDRI